MVLGFCLVLTDSSASKLLVFAMKILVYHGYIALKL